MGLKFRLSESVLEPPGAWIDISLTRDRRVRRVGASGVMHERLPNLELVAAFCLHASP